MELNIQRTTNNIQTFSKVVSRHKGHAFTLCRQPKSTIYLQNSFNSSPAQSFPGFYNFNFQRQQRKKWIKKQNKKKKKHIKKQSAEPAVASTTEVGKVVELIGNLIHFCVNFQSLPNQRLLGGGINSSKQQGVIKVKTTAIVNAWLACSNASAPHDSNGISWSRTNDYMSRQGLFVLP